MTTYGVNIVQECSTWAFNSCYSENLPSANVATNAMFRVGFDGSTPAVAQQLQIVGGYWAGRNGSPAYGSWITTDTITAVAISGMPHVTRFIDAILTSSNTTTNQILSNGFTMQTVTTAVSDLTKFQGAYPAGVLNSGFRAQQNAEHGKVSAGLWVDTSNSYSGTYLSSKTVVKTISVDDDASVDDYQLDDDAANNTEQVVQMYHLRAYCDIVSVQVRCFETVAGSGSTVMGIDVGTTSGGAEVIATANIDTANDILVPAAGTYPLIAATNAPRYLYVNFKPTANWDTLTAGRWSVLITYIGNDTAHNAGIPQ
jgi:hypothetical protein